MLVKALLLYLVFSSLFAGIQHQQDMTLTLDNHPMLNVITKFPAALEDLSQIKTFTVDLLALNWEFPKNIQSGTIKKTIQIAELFYFWMSNCAEWFSDKDGNAKVKRIHKSCQTTRPIKLQQTFNLPFTSGPTFYNILKKFLALNFIS